MREASFEARAAEIGAKQIGTGEVRFAEVAAAQYGAGELGLVELEARHFEVLEIAMAQVRPYAAVETLGPAMVFGEDFFEFLDLDCRHGLSVPCRPVSRRDTAKCLNCNTEHNRC